MGGADTKKMYTDTRMYNLHKEVQEAIETFIFDVLVGIRDPDFTKKREATLDLMRDKVEKFVVHYNYKRLHKLVFFLLIKAQANVLLELREYDRAIKALKSLKNYCKRWQRYGETH